MKDDFSDIPAERQPTKNQLMDRAKRLPPGFARHVALVLETSIKLKRSMIKRGLRRARAICPRCGGGDGTLQGALVGPRNHLRMWCDTPGCSMEVME